MYAPLFAAVAVAVSLGWGLPAAAAQQQATPPGGAAGGAPTAQQPTGATADQAKMQTYLQMRKFLQSQVFSTVPADLSKDKATIETLLKSQNRPDWMSADEFIQFHRQVQSDPALKARADAAVGLATGTSGAARTPRAEPVRRRTPSGARPGGSPM